MSATWSGKTMKQIGGALWLVAIISALIVAFGGDRFYGEDAMFYVFWSAAVVGSGFLLVGWFWGRSKRPT
jgi:hypothetical protein